MTGEILKSVSFDAWTSAAAGIMERIDRIAALEAEMLALGETINVLQPPPTGCGSWDGKKRSAPKDRWVYPLRPDPVRAPALSLERHGSVFVRWPWASFVEPVWRRGVPHGGGGDFAKFTAERRAA